MGVVNEFKKFVMRGNVMDMAIGVIIGGAFTSIATSLNQDVLTPILGIFGGVDFSDLFIKLGTNENAPVLAYGKFITSVINFLITAFVIFCIVKTMNILNEKILVATKKEEDEKQKQEEEKPTTKKCDYCKSTIDIEAIRCPHCTSELK